MVVEFEMVGLRGMSRPVDVDHGGGGGTSPAADFVVDLASPPWGRGDLGFVLPGAALDAADEQQARPRRSSPARSSSPSRRSRKARTEAASGPEIGGHHVGRRRGRVEEEMGGGFEERE
jgi:hypothetical protein